MSTSAYIRSLNQHVQQTRVPPPSPLSQRFINWYNSLPEVSRHRPFAMQEFETALGTQGRYISPVLLKQGWSRKRRWSSKGQYFRYWLPPN